MAKLSRITKAKWTKPLLWVVGVAVIVYFVSRNPISEIIGAFRQMGWRIIFLPLALLSTQALRTTGLYILLKRKVAWWALLRNRLMGEGYNSIIPAGGLAGEPLKAKDLSRYVSTNHAVTAVITDRLMITSTGLLTSGFLVGLANAFYDWDARLERLLTIYVLCVCAVGSVIVLGASSRAPSGIARRLLKWFGSKDIEAVHTVSRRRFFTAFSCHVTGSLAKLLNVTYVLFLLDMPVDFHVVVAVTGAVAASGVLGFFIPQGIGVSEAASVYAFQLAGLPEVLGVTYGLARRGAMLFFSVVGVTLHASHAARLAAKANADAANTQGDGDSPQAESAS